jgi:hypothetical protein
MQKKGNNIPAKNPKDGPSSRPSFFISLKKNSYVQNLGTNQQAYSSQFYKKKTGFGESLEMAKSHHRVSLLRNYKSIRTLISHFELQILD